MGFKDFIGNTWNNIKNTASETWNNSKNVANNAYNKVKYYGGQAIEANRKAAENTFNTINKYGGSALNFLDKHKSSISTVAGKTLKTVGEATGNPYIIAGGVALSGLGKAFKENDEKNAIQKELEEQRMKQYGNRYIAYSDMPRIHYSKGPIGYGMIRLSHNSFRKPNYTKIDSNNPRPPSLPANKPKKAKGKKK